MTNQQLATRNTYATPQTHAPASITDLLQEADVYLKSGFLPQSIKTPQQAVVIMLKGRELGIQPWAALNGINVINGKPTCGSELMLSLIKRDHGQDAIHFLKTTAELCTIQYRNGKYEGTYTFGLDDAKRAGLAGGQTWQKYPAAMLRARCISAVARMVFPGSIAGMYTPEEVGGSVTVDENGEVIEAPKATATTIEEEVREDWDKAQAAVYHEERSGSAPTGLGDTVAKLPHPDAVSTSEWVNGKPVWMVLGLPAVETVQPTGGRFLTASIKCLDHDKPFFLAPDGDAWAHGMGKGKDKCYYAPPTEDAQPDIDEANPLNLPFD